MADPYAAIAAPANDPYASIAANDSSAPDKPKPSSWIDALRSIPGGLAKGVDAVAGLPGDIENLTRQGVTSALGMLPGAPGAVARAASQGPASHPGSQQLNTAVSKPFGGFYQPQTTAGKYAETIASFAPSAAVPGGALTRAARVVLPGAASEAAGELTQDANGQDTALTPYARTLGALAGGVAPSIASAGMRVANKATAAIAGNGFLDPNVEAARRLSTAFAQDGGLPSALGKADSFANSGASAPSVLDLGGGNVRRLIRAAAGGGDTAQGVVQTYGDQVRANLQDNVTNRATQLTGDTRSPAQVTAQTQQAQRVQGRADYQGPGSQPVQLTDETARALRGTTGTAAIDRAMKDAEVNQDYETINDLNAMKIHDLDQPTVVTGRAVEAIRQAYGRMAEEAAAKPGGDYAQGGLLGRQGALDSTLDQSPGFQTARQNYRTNQSARDAVPLGSRALTMPSNQYAEQIGQLAGVGGPPDLRGLQVGARQAITDAVEAPAAGATGVLSKLGTSNRATANLAATFGEQPAASFQEAVRNEVQRLRNANFVSPESGSQTQLRGADEGLMGAAMGGIKGIVSSIADKILRGAQLTPAEREAIARIGTSEADVRRFATVPQSPVTRIAPSIANINASRAQAQ